MKKLIILQGLPASGKSTYAKALVEQKTGMYKRVNRDDLRMMLDVGHYSKANEKLIRRTRDWLILEGLKAGKHVIVDDTNLEPSTVERLKKIAEQHREETGQNVKVEIKMFEIDVEEAIRRDAKRANSVGEKVIRSMHRRLLKKEEHTDRGPNYRTQNAALPKAIICDLDGTLAIIDGRSPFDASACENDALNAPIATIVKEQYALGVRIILLSGRMDTYKPQTLKWLAKYEIPYHDLIMRKEGDVRKDSVVKREFYEDNIGDQFFVKFVLDDRNQVVDMWRNELGLACLQVNYGDF